MTVLLVPTTHPHVLLPSSEKYPTFFFSIYHSILVSETHATVLRTSGPVLKDDSLQGSGGHMECYGLKPGRQ